MQPQNNSYNSGEYDSSGVSSPVVGSASTGVAAPGLDDRSRFRSPPQGSAASYGSLDVVPAPAPAPVPAPAVTVTPPSVEADSVTSVSPEVEAEPEGLSDNSLESRMAADSLEPVATDPIPTDQTIQEAGVELEGPEKPPKTTVSRGNLSLFRYNRRALFTTFAAMLAILLIGATGWLLTSINRGGSESPQGPSSYASGSNLQLNDVKSNQDLQIGEASQLTVNGQLQVSDALTLKPISRPSDPSSGQIYYDKAANALYYYNGKEFVELGGGVSSLGGSKGAITLGNGLVMSGGQLSVSSSLLQSPQQNISPGSYVASLQGRTGDVTLVGESGINVNGTVISNDGVVSLSSGSANLVVTSNGAGHYVITDTGAGSGVVSITGTANQVQVSSSTGNVTLSLPQDIAAGSSPTFSNLHLGSSGVFAGGLILANASNSNTATIYSDPLGQSTIYTLPDPHQASVDICLSSGNCAGSGGGLVGGGTATHIAKFTNGNTLADSGLTETGSTLTYAGNLVVNADGSFTGNLLNLEVGGSSKLSVNEHGDSTQGGTLTVNGTGTSSIAGSLNVGTGLTVTSGGADIAGDSVIVGTLSGLTGLSSSGTVTLSGIGGAGVVHSDGSGNLTSSAVVLGSDTSGDYVARLGTLSGLTATGNSGAGSTPDLSVAYGASAGTAVQGNTTLTCASGTGNLSGGGNSVTLGSGGTCGDLTITDSPTFTGSVTVGDAGASDGSLILANGANSNLTTLQSAAAAQDQTIVIPDSGSAYDEVCLVDLGNCAGSGGGVTGTGTAGTIALFSGSHIIGNSAITQTGTGPTATVTVAGTLAATYLQGDGSGVTNVDAVTLQGHASNYFTNASNLSSGTLSDARLSTNVALLDHSNNFTGTTLQHNGQDICDASGNCAGAGGGVTTTGGTDHTIAMFTGSQTIADSILSQSNDDTAINVAGGLVASGLLQGSTLDIASGAFQVDSGGNATGGTYNGAVITSTTFNTATISGGSLTGGSVSGGSLTATTVNGLGLTSSAITGTGALSISAGGTNQDLSLQGSGTGSVIIQTPTFHNANGATYSFDSTDVAATSATICTTVGNCAGTGGGIIGSGTPGQVAFFNGTGSITSDSGLAYSSGNLTATGAIQGASLSLVSGSHTLTLQSGSLSGDLTLTLPTAYGSNGDCLETDGSGHLSFQSCTGGAGGGVTSLNGLTGILSLQGTANQISVSDNGSDTLTLSLPQDIATTSDPQFNDLTLDGTLAVTGTITGSSTIQGTQLISTVATGTAPLTVASTTLVTNLNADLLDGQQGSYYRNANNINAGTLGATHGGTGQTTVTTGDLLVGTSGNAWSKLGIGATNSCLVSDGTTASWSSCSSGGGITGSGTSGQVAYFDGSGSITSSADLLFDGTTLTPNALSVTSDATIGGNLGVAGNVTGGTYNGAAITSTTFNGLTLNGTTITGSGALAIASGGTNQDLTLDASGSGQINIGGTSTGNIVLGGGSGSTGCTLTNSTGDFYCAGTVKALNNLQAVNGSIQALNGNVDSTRASAGNNAFTAMVSGDSQVRYQVNADGKIQWGDGTNALDTNLYRAVTGQQLNTDGSFYVNQNLGVGGNINGQTISSASVFTGTVAVQGANALTLGTSSSHTGAITFKTAAGANAITLQGPSTNPGGNYTLSIPNLTANDTICTVGLGNCDSLSGSGSAGTLAMFTGTGTTVGNSILSQSASTLTAAGNLIINAGTGFTGNLINLEVNSNSKLSVDQSGNTIQAGTLSVNGTGASSIAGSLSVGVLGTNGTTSLCSNAGTISSCANTGTQGFWTRTGTTLQPANSGDTITTSGSIATTGNGNVTVGSAGGTATLTVNGSLGSISTSTSGNNLNFSRDGANYIEATDSGGTLRLGAGGNSNNIVLNTDGSVLLQNAGDSSSAFQIQDTDSDPLFNVDSQSKIINVGGTVATVTVTPGVAPSGGGTVGSWGTTTALPTAVYGASTVAYNGYMYQIGGYNGSAGISTTYSAPINAGGTLGSWTSRTALPTTLYNATAVVYNGYVYVMGGYTGSSELSTVYYASLNNGVIGAWNTTTSLPSTRQLATSTVNNGYVYILAGSTSGTAQTSVNFASINANGTLGTWYTATSLPAARAGASTIVNNGYIYEIGGGTTPSCTPSGTSTVYYASINGDGTLNSWVTDTANTADSRFGAGTVAWGGYAYMLGGTTTSGACTPGYLYHYASLNNDGSTDSGTYWPNNNAYDEVFQMGTVVYNGYAYMLGGTTNGTTNVSSTVAYVSLSGSQGSAASQTVNPNDGNAVDFTQNGHALFQNATDSATSFQVQNSSATDLFTVDTLNNRVIVGTASSTPTLLVLGTKNTLGDPTCVSGGMYYNSSTGQAKVCLGGSWAAVGVPTVTSLPANPSDGDEVYYKVYVNGQLSGNTGYWHLRYNASTGYWDFLGGPALYSLDPNSRFNSTSTYSNTGSPYAYLPLNGDYDITYGDTLSQNQTSTFDEMSLCLQLTTSPCANAMFTVSDGAYGGTALSQTFRLSGITGAGGTAQYVRPLYSSPSNINSGFANMFVSVTPVRVK